MSEPTIVVTFCCATCSERRDVPIPFGNADVFEQALLQCVPDRWTKNAAGLFECPRHRPGHVSLAAIALSGSASTVRR
jgi:hypothetical protein